MLRLQSAPTVAVSEFSSLLDERTGDAGFSAKTQGLLSQLKNNPDALRQVSKPEEFVSFASDPPKVTEKSPKCPFGLDDQQGRSGTSPSLQNIKMSRMDVRTIIIDAKNVTKFKEYGAEKDSVAANSHLGDTYQLQALVSEVCRQFGISDNGPSSTAQLRICVYRPTLDSVFEKK